jgi:hypothetical protein
MAAFQITKPMELSLLAQTITTFSMPRQPQACRCPNLAEPEIAASAQG